MDLGGGVQRRRQRRHLRRQRAVAPRFRRTHRRPRLAPLPRRRAVADENNVGPLRRRRALSRDESLRGSQPGVEMRQSVLIAALLLFLLPHHAWAQDSCAAPLPEAQKAYDAGDFARAAALLRERCAGRLSRTMAVQVQSLLARALMYDERPDEARTEVSKLLRIEPGFDDRSEEHT